MQKATIDSILNTYIILSIIIDSNNIIIIYIQSMKATKLGFEEAAGIYIGVGYTMWL